MIPRCRLCSSLISLAIHFVLALRNRFLDFKLRWTEFERKEKCNLYGKSEQGTGGGGFEPRFNPGSNSGAGSEGGEAEYQHQEPGFNPGSTQVQPRFNPG